MYHLRKLISKKNELKNLVILVAFVMLAQISNAQVTMGSDLLPNKDAILDLQQDGETKAGLLLPRVALQESSSAAPMSAHTQGMAIYNTAKVKDVSPGYYYNNGTKWLKLFVDEDSFFYMPTTTLPTDENDLTFANGKFTVDLHDIYQEQFSLSSATVVVSDNTAKLPVYGSNALYYFITYFDNTVFDEVKVSTSGILTYKIKAGFTYSDKTFMNIIFKVK